jgi:hypothetical protein
VNGLRALKGRTYVDIEADAKQTRETLRLDEGAVPGAMLFERLDDLVAVTTKGDIPVIASPKEGIPAEGLTHFRPDREENGQIELMLREDVYQALRRDEPRARFTLMHELGHVVLHANDLVQHGELPHFGAGFRRANKSGTHKPWQDTEWQANAFAGAFLMPARELRALERAGMLTTLTLVRRFGVSAEAANYRIKIYSDRRSELMCA